MPYIIFIFVLAAAAFNVSAQTISEDRKRAVLAILDRLRAEQRTERQEAAGVNQLRDAVFDSEISEEKKQAILEILAAPQELESPPAEPLSEEELRFALRNCSYKKSMVKRLFPHWNQRHWCETELETALSSGYSYQSIASMVRSMPAHSPKVERRRNRPISR